MCDNENERILVCLQMYRYRERKIEEAEKQTLREQQGEQKGMRLCNRRERGRE